MSALATNSSFADVVSTHGVDLSPVSVETLQVNITKLCNQACVHCHVDASPRRREMMSDAVLDQCLALMRRYPEIKILDITGGAPELHPRFKDLVVATRALGRRVIVRHNLTVTLDPHPLTRDSMQDLPAFFAAQRVEVVSSLPCYQESNTNKQRGDGVFDKSIESLKRLNAVGFGVEGSGLTLNLVYNPLGPNLPPAQAGLEVAYKRELADAHGITFNHLFALTNMPIHRFKAQLRRSGGYEEYMEKLASAFNATAAAAVMCRSLVSVAHDGSLYDCDFNQMLGMNIVGEDQRPLTIFDATPENLAKRRIRVADHCFGCTAGAGSSCGGTIA